MLQMGEEIRITQADMSQMKEHTAKINTQTIRELNQLRTEMINDNQVTQKTLSKHTTRLDLYNSRIRLLEDTLEATIATLGQRSEQLTSVEKEIIEIHAGKVSTTVAEHSFQKTAKKMKKLKTQAESINNQQISLENWVEKYLPLKLQH